jgi:acyl-CoA thioester hydrolase
MGIVTKLQIRFNDVDLAGHVHNGVHLSYFEQGRMNYFNTHIGENWDWKKYGLILARNEVDYLKPIYLQDDLHVETRLEHFGGKSFTLSYRIFRMEEGKEVDCSKGKSILVCFDYIENETIEVPQEWRDKFK